jgi:NADPH:quinone reductase-like Zn-dependent oxidoreductase
MAASVPKVMRVVHQPDPKSSTLVLEEGPVPIPSGPSDILIKVAATSPCLGELTWTAAMPDYFPADREPVPGQDVTGTVVEASEDSGFKPGDEVFGRINAVHPGGCREYAIVKKEETAIKPKSLGWEEAAATPLSALTAWQAVFVQGTLEKDAVFGDEAARGRNASIRVFIAGAGTSVGMWAVQFAALAGAGAVVALASGAKADLLRRLGATDLVDYTRTSADAWVREGEDRETQLIVDCIGGAAMGDLWSVVKEGGTFLSICGHPDAVKPESCQKTLQKSVWFIVESLGVQLAEIARLMEAGKVKPLIDSTFGFEQFQEAFDKVESRKTNGKVVIKLFS